MTSRRPSTLPIPTPASVRLWPLQITGLLQALPRRQWQGWQEGPEGQERQERHGEGGEEQQAEGEGCEDGEEQQAEGEGCEGREGEARGEAEEAHGRNPEVNIIFKFRLLFQTFLGPLKLSMTLYKGLSFVVVKV